MTQTTERPTTAETVPADLPPSVPEGNPAVVGVPTFLVGSIALGLLEAYASFWSSAFKETIVFGIIIPPLIWLSLRSRHVEEEEEE